MGEQDIQNGQKTVEIEQKTAKKCNKFESDQNAKNFENVFATMSLNENENED